MSNKTTTAHTVVATLTPEQESEIVASLRTLYPIVCGGAHGEQLPDFNALSVEEYGKVFGRAYIALQNAHKARKEAKARAFRQQIQGVIDTHIASHRAQMSQLRAELDAMSPMMRQIVMSSGKVPDANTVMVPMSEIVAQFKTGTAEADVVRKLTTFGYKVAKKGDSTYVKVTLSENSAK